MTGNFITWLRKVKEICCYRIEHFAGRPHGPPLPPSSVTTGSCRRAITAGSGSAADAVTGAAPVLESL